MFKERRILSGARVGFISSSESLSEMPMQVVRSPLSD